MTAYDPFEARATLETPDGERIWYRLDALAGLGDVATLPLSIKVLLESCLRNCDGRVVTEDHVRSLAAYDPTDVKETEIAFTPGRVVLQDFTGRDNHAGNRGGHVMLYGRIHAILRGRDVDIRGGSAVEGGLVALDAPEDGKLDFYRCNLHDGQASTAGGLIHHSGRFTLDNTLSECDLSRGIGQGVRQIYIGLEPLPSPY